MKATSVFVRLAGLMAIVGGVASSTLGSLIALHARDVELGSLGMGLQKGHYQNQVFADRTSVEALVRDKV